MNIKQNQVDISSTSNFGYFSIQQTKNKTQNVLITWINKYRKKIFIIQLYWGKLKI